MHSRITHLAQTMVLLLITMTAAMPAQADDTAVNAYYAAADGKKGAELKTALYAIIRNPQVLTYGQLWTGFYETDRMSNDECRDRYSDNHRYFTSAGGAISGMNKEHGIPKSWWGGSGTAYSDLHHLMPSDAEANQRKSNFSMGIVSNLTWTNGSIRVGYGTAGNNGAVQMWEPADAWKGDFARAMFYIVTAYEELNMVLTQGANTMQTTTWPKLQPWAYSLFLEWAAADPVDDIERARNEAVCAIQGNRNPFIDFPDLAEYIWGTKTETPFHVGDGTHGGTDPHDPQEPEVQGDSIVILQQNFTASIGDFTAIAADGTASAVWTQNSRYGAVANAYSLGKTADAWLISPPLDLHGQRGATFSISHAAGYHDSADPHSQFQVLVSTNYAGTAAPGQAEWQEIDVTWPDEMLPSSRFTRYADAIDVSLDDFVGHRDVRLAFRYRADNDHCWAWEIKSVTVKGRPLPTEIAGMADDDIQNFLSPIPGDVAVFTPEGRWLGTDIPTRPGIYLVRRNGHTRKQKVVSEK